MHSKQYAHALGIDIFDIESLSNLRDACPETLSRSKIVDNHFMLIRDNGERFYLSTAQLWKWNDSGKYTHAGFVIIALHENESPERAKNHIINVNGETLSVIGSEAAHHRLVELLKRIRKKSMRK